MTTCAKQLGDVCAASAECDTNYCAPGSKTCSVFCSQDADCGAGLVCAPTPFAFAGASAKACKKPCINDDACTNPNATSSVCFLHVSGVATPTLTCDTPPPADAMFGDLVPAGKTCYSGIVVTVAGNRTCSRACDVSSPQDCGGALPICASRKVINPNGGTLDVVACGP